jgi:hypothetical protein
MKDLAAVKPAFAPQSRYRAMSQKPVGSGAEKQA